MFYLQKCLLAWAISYYYKTSLKITLYLHVLWTPMFWTISSSYFVLSQSHITITIYKTLVSVQNVSRTLKMNIVDYFTCISLNIFLFFYLLQKNSRGGNLYYFSTIKFKISANLQKWNIYINNLF